MTSKSPVRSCDDLDESALSYAEIKALCTGNPLIKEKMNLDIEVAKLKVLRANHLSMRYDLEDKLNKYFPEIIQRRKEYIIRLENDCKLLSQTTNRHTIFPGMIINGQVYVSKDEAGAALLECRKQIKNDETINIGTFAGFSMLMSYNHFDRVYELTCKGETSHVVKLGPDVLGNITRINNVLDGIYDKLTTTRDNLENLYSQVENANKESIKPFQFEKDLNTMSQRLKELDILLNIDESNNDKDSLLEHDTSVNCDIKTELENKNNIKDSICL